MRILLDECLPRRLKFDLVGHEVDTVPEAGWAGKSNGEAWIRDPRRSLNPPGGRHRSVGRDGGKELGS
jgi:hypothetical protein